MLILVSVPFLNFEVRFIQQNYCSVGSVLWPVEESLAMTYKVPSKH